MSTLPSDKNLKEAKVVSTQAISESISPRRSIKSLKKLCRDRHRKETTSTPSKSQCKVLEDKRNSN